MVKAVLPEQHCAACGLLVPPGTVRCPRCNQLLLPQMRCYGNCRSCAADCHRKQRRRLAIKIER